MKTEPPRSKAKTKPPEIIVPGIAVSRGVAIGLVYDTTEPATEVMRRTIAAEAVDDEKQKLAAAVAFSRKQVGKLKTRISVLPEEAQEEIAPLLDAHLMMLGNSRMIRGARKRIEPGCSAPRPPCSRKRRRSAPSSSPPVTTTRRGWRAAPTRSATSAAG